MKVAVNDSLRTFNAKSILFIQVFSEMGHVKKLML